MGTMLTALVDLGADIQHLKLTGCLATDHLQSLTSLGNVRSLKLSLSIGSWTHAMIDMISSFHVLEELSLDFDRIQFLSILLQATDTRSNVRKLSLVGRFPLILQALDMFPRNKLESITLEQASNGLLNFPISQSRQYYQNVGRFSSLTTIFVDWGDDYFNGYANASAEDMESFLHPLWSSPALESLTLRSIPLCLVLSDPTITSISTAVPLIRVLHLEQPIQPHSLLPTFKSLARLANSCPHLVKLSLTIDGARARPPSLNGVSYHGLQELHLLNTLIGSYTQTASYIDRLFPNLRCIGAFAYADSDIVNDIIVNACRPARRDHKNRDLLACGRPRGVAGH